jgi:hypothetical protein
MDKTFEKENEKEKGECDTAPCVKIFRRALSVNLNLFLSRGGAASSSAS